MITTYISRVLSLCFYAALLFITIGFGFIIINGIGRSIVGDEINFAPIIKLFFAGNSNAAFMIAAFMVCLSPFCSAIVLIVYSIRNKHPLIIAYSVLLIVLLTISLIFE